MTNYWGREENNARAEPLWFEMFLLTPGEIGSYPSDGMKLQKINFI
jgi:hypothetical protein